MKQLHQFLFTKLNAFIKGISLVLEIHEQQPQEGGKACLKYVTLSLLDMLT